MVLSSPWQKLGPAKGAASRACFANARTKSAQKQSLRCAASIGSPARAAPPQRPTPRLPDCSLQVAASNGNANKGLMTSLCFKATEQLLQGSEARISPLHAKRPLPMALLAPPSPLTFLPLLPSFPPLPPTNVLVGCFLNDTASNYNAPARICLIVALASFERHSWPQNPSSPDDGELCGTALGIKARAQLMVASFVALLMPWPGPCSWPCPGPCPWPCPWQARSSPSSPGAPRHCRPRPRPSCRG